MKNDPLLTPRQFASVLLVSMISPVFRQSPGAAAGTAGSGAWVSALLSGGVFLLLFLLARGVLCFRREGEGLGELILRGLPRGSGKLVTGLLTVYLALYAGFVLRSGADRFVSAVYPESEDWLFLSVMALLLLPGALGKLKWLGRCAELAGPFLLLLLGGVFLFALPGTDTEALRLWDADPGGIAAGALPLLDTLCVAIYPLFLLGETRREGLARPSLRVCLALTVMVLLLSVTVVGTFGPALADRMNYPFFVMIRGVEVLHLLERVEPLIVGQWVITDFLLLSVLLQTASHTGALTFGGSRRGWTAGLSAAAAFCGFVCARDSSALRELSRSLIPLANAGMVCLIVLAGTAARCRLARR